ncbi:uncharacterized protein [Typha angustifolia]|uniref:uncharacterized protein n=1 Tax=Typha angustifolia TaxID=59011 RepID=UPI003C2F3FC0
MSCTPWTPPSPLKLHHSSFPKKKKFLCCSLHGDPKSDAVTSTLPRLLLHDSLDAAGIDTLHARAAREEFCRQIKRMTAIDAETSITISRGPDLARAVLNVGAEDDSLVSHSSVPLPVDAFIDRLDDLSMGFCSTYMPPSSAPPEVYIDNLERYLYIHKGFRRSNAMLDARALYLHSALTCRSGSVDMLSLIYSEMLKMLRICSFLEFDVEIYFPHDLDSLPRGYHKQKSKLSDEHHIMTSKSLLVRILTNLKEAFWPFPYDHSSNLFLRAMRAANHMYGPGSVGEMYSRTHNNVSGLEIASAKAAQHRLERGVWTTARFGDMRRALAACERLILLRDSYQELRDYAALLYHCGYYEDSLQCLTTYQKSMDSQSDHVDSSKEDAVKNLMARLNLILAEEGWNKHKISASYWSNKYEPW